MTNKQTRKLPSPIVLQRASKAVLAGKCNLSRPTYLKLKKHRNIMRKLANMTGTPQQKMVFVKSNMKQVGGLLPLLPLIAKAVGSLAVPLLGSLLSRR